MKDKEYYEENLKNSTTRDISENIRWVGQASIILFKVLLARIKYLVRGFSFDLKTSMLTKKIKILHGSNCSNALGLFMPYLLKNNSERRTLLSRHWVYAFLLSSIINIIIQVLFRCDQVYSKSPICTAEPPSYWIWLATCFEAIAFFTKGIGILWHAVISQTITEIRSESAVSTLISAATISFIAGSSSMLTSIWNWGGVCEDPFGVRSRATRTGEWISCVPYLMYIVIAIDYKPHYSNRDKTVLVSITLAMIFTCLLQFPVSFSVAIAFLIIGLSFAAISAYYFLVGDIQGTADLDDEMARLYFEEIYSVGGQKRTRNRLAFLLCCTFPLFPFIYFLSMGKIISHDTTDLLFIIANMSAKMFFSAVATDVHLDVLYHALLSQQSRFTESRKAFIRYIMHEIRVPLNALSMGISVLIGNNDTNNDPNQVEVQDEYESETLTMMRDASTSMENTLNDIVLMQMFEHGTFELIFTNFKVVEMVNKSIELMESAASINMIHVDLHMSPDVPRILLGDDTRISYVITTLLANAIRSSRMAGHVSINVFIRSREEIEVIPRSINSPALSNRSGEGQRSRSRSPRMEGIDNQVLFTVVVMDYGAGMSTNEMRVLFEPYQNLRTGELQQGISSGISIPLCRHIIELHGGRMQCESQIDIGTIITFMIPLLVPQMDHLESSVASLELQVANLRASGTNANICLTDDFLRFQNVTLLPLSYNIPETIETSLAQSQSQSRNNFHDLSISRADTVDTYMSDVFTPRDANESSHRTAHTAISSVRSNSLSFYRSVHLQSQLQLQASSPRSRYPERGRTDGTYGNDRRSDNGDGDDGAEGEVLSSRDIVLINRILIVDDVVSCRKLLTFLLRREKIDSDEACDGVEAVSMVGKDVNLYSLIFMDFTMPNMYLSIYAFFSVFRTTTSCTTDLLESDRSCVAGAS
eukprot:gene6753-13688_t